MKLRTWCIRIGHILTKTGSALKMALLLMLVCFANAAKAELDTQGITIRQQNVSLEKVFQSIEKQSGYRFFYNESLLAGAGKVSLNLQNVSLQEALNACFRDQPFTYSIVERTIIVKRKVVVHTAASAPLGKIIAVRGKITSNNVPVIGATVTVKGTDNATLTDNNGIFTLADVDDQGTLMVTHVNHQAREVRLKGEGFIAIDLEGKVSDLDEAVVVAYNTTTQRRNTGSVTVVKGEEVQNLPYRSVDKSLQGLVPGLLVTSGTGQPGGGLSNFVLRGVATGGNPDAGSTVRNPLIVLDGIPITQDNFQWTADLRDAPVFNPMAQLNPSDIESITVLKDAAAIALFGAKASNGVILITSKQGKSGKTKFSLRHQTDIASRLKGKIELLNQEEYLELLYETYKNTPRIIGGVSVPWTDETIKTDLLKYFPYIVNSPGDTSFYPMTDWSGEIYNNHAITISNDISMSGGNEKNKFYLSFEYTKQDGIYKKTGYDRKSIRFNFENRPASWLKLGINNTLSYNIQNYASLVGGTFPMGIATYFPPLNPARDQNNNLILNYKYPYEVANPLAAMEYNNFKNTAFRGLSKAYGEVNILRNLKFTSSLGIDYMQMEAVEKVDPRLYDYTTKSLGGRLQERNTRNANLITNNILRFDGTIKSVHTMNLLVGQEAQILTSKFIQAYATNLGATNSNQINTGGTGISSNSRQTFVSYFGQANYGYRSRYFLTGSIRKDGSSRFGENRRFGTYWSTGLGWLISAEPFMKETSSWLDYLKVRGSAGAAGNTAAIDKLARYDLLLSGSFQNNASVYPYYPGNPDIQWEQTYTWDAGLEARIWKERISVTADIYKRKTSNLIYEITLPPITGSGTVKDNIGDMENKGIELSLSVDIIRQRDIKWTVNANWSANKNILVKANVPLAVISGTQLANEEGRNFNSFYLVRWAGVNPADGSPQWIDSTGKPNGTYNAAKREWVGKPQPDGFGAVTNTVTFKNIELSAIFYYQYGFQVYNQYTLTADGFQPYQNQDKRALDYWKKEGDIAANPKRTLNNSNGVFSTSTRHLYDGDFIRFQTLALSYNFPHLLTSRLRLSMLKIYAQAHNLAVWTKFPGGDISNINSAGGSNISYPNQRSFSVGLNVNF